MSYDVIVVGARVAGSATAMLMARQGLSVLVIDRAAFPSDTLSTHQVQVPGAARLRRWGVLDALERAGTPATRRITFSTGPSRLTASVPTVDDTDAMYSPRRTRLDAALVDAAREAGAEVAESTIVDGLLFESDRVVGVRLQAKGGAPREVRTRLVVGADGKHSLVARAVDAPVRRQFAATSLAFYTYWEDVDLDHAVIEQAPGQAVGVFPTDDGRVISYLAWPASKLATFRSDRVRAVESTLQATREVGERVLAGRRVEPIRATTDVPNVVRTPYGPGWALAGDAGLVMDPITGQGIGHALRDAELLSAAVASGLGGSADLSAALRGYARARDKETLPMFSMTVGLASFPEQTPAEAAMFAAIAADQREADRFIAVMSGVMPPGRFFTPPHLIKLVGLRSFVQLARSRPRAA